MDVEAVHVAHKARADAGGEHGGIKRRHLLARGRGRAGAADATQSAGDGIPAVFASSRGSFSRWAPRFAKKTNPIRLLRAPAPGRLTGVMIMANNQMTAQMSKKGGFIAALDQSGGAAPGGRRPYGIPASAFFRGTGKFRVV